MAEAHAARRLAAILAADVAGYTRLMGEDEDGTLASLSSHLEQLIRPTVSGTNGRIVKTMSLGRMGAGYYESKTKAAYWDGKSDAGEPVSAGVYFCHLKAGDYSAVRRMVVVRGSSRIGVGDE